MTNTTTAKDAIRAGLLQMLAELARMIPGASFQARNARDQIGAVRDLVWEQKWTDARRHLYMLSAGLKDDRQDEAARFAFWISRAIGAVKNTF